jgi:DNA-binding response OmpR family regulator
VTEIKPKILIVEDDLDVAEMLNAYFGVQGFEVFTVNWGEDGVRSCQTVHPDLVILDIRLPDIDGYEVARRLRGDRRTSDIPIIFLTEKRERSDRLEGLEIGADDYITKPFDVQELRLRVQNSLKRLNREAISNPVTGLPEGSLVDEKLAEVLDRDNAALLVVSVEHMDSFREAYGFVAADDALRAISLMIINTLREFSRPDDFLAHLTSTDFILVINPSTLSVLKDKLHARLEQSVEYFYPVKDREHAAARSDRMSTKIIEIASLAGGKYSTVDQLKKELLHFRK